MSNQLGPAASAAGLTYTIPHVAQRTKRTPVRWKRYWEWSAWQTEQLTKRLRAREAATAGVGSKTKPSRPVGRAFSLLDPAWDMG